MFVSKVVAEGNVTRKQALVAGLFFLESLWYTQVAVP